MKYFIFSVLCILCSTTAYSETSKDLICQNHSLFVYQVAQARDSGVSIASVKDSIHRVFIAHPELSDAEDEHAMDVAVDYAFALKSQTPDMLQRGYFKFCMDEVGT